MLLLLDSLLQERLWLPASPPLLWTLLLLEQKSQQHRKRHSVLCRTRLLPTRGKGTLSQHPSQPSTLTPTVQRSPWLAWLTTLPQSMLPLTLLTPRIRDPWLQLTLKELNRRQQLPSSPLPPTPGLRASRLTLPSGRP